MSATKINKRISDNNSILIALCRFSVCTNDVSIRRRGRETKKCYMWLMWEIHWSTKLSVIIQRTGLYAMIVGLLGTAGQAGPGCCSCCCWWRRWWCKAEWRHLRRWGPVSHYASLRRPSRAILYHRAVRRDDEQTTEVQRVVSTKLSRGRRLDHVHRNRRRFILWQTSNFVGWVNSSCHCAIGWVELSSRYFSLFPAK